MRPKSFHSTVRQLLTSLIFLRCTVAVAALPELHPRQDCDTAICPDWSWFSTIGEKAQESWQSISAYLGGYLLKNPPEESFPTNPTESPLPGSGQGIDPQNPWDTEPKPQIELFSTTQCPLGAPDADYDSSDPIQLRQCLAAPAQIVVPTDCTNPKNALVAQKLTVMDPSFKTSRSPRCAGEHGVVFWLAHITPDQIASILGETDGAVKSIVPDSPLKTPPLTPVPGLRASHRSVPRKSKTENGLKEKRGVLEKYNDFVYDPSLAFLSIAPGKTYDDSGDTSDPYVYFRTAVESAMQTHIRVYLVDSGYDPRTKQIRQEGLEWYYGIGTRKRAGDTRDHHGTCIASKIGGSRYGVFKGAPVFTIVKISASVASLIDALGYILTEIVNKKTSVEGRAVVNISPQWALAKEQTDIAELMLLGIEAILAAKIMIVTPGTNSAFAEAGNDPWPGNLAEVLDMITVGGVAPINIDPTTPYGSLFSWALPGATLYAPGVGFCVKSASQGDYEDALNGPTMPSAITTGLVAYLLAIPDLQEYFMAQPNWALAVKQYVKAMSYPRYQLVSLSGMGSMGKIRRQCIIRLGTLGLGFPIMETLASYKHFYSESCC